tara:strand:+ start:1235 stop:1429 length:195 start_codon:yes stop_codon:yes gene_type:complete
MLSFIKWTCCECGSEYTEQTGDTDERMCDECLNHEDDFKNPTEDIEKIEDKLEIITCIGYRGEE